jgi:hypothetical protein
MANAFRGDRRAATRQSKLIGDTTIGGVLAALHLDLLGDQAFQSHVTGGTEQLSPDFSLFKIGQKDAVGMPAQQASKADFPEAERDIADILNAIEKDVEGAKLHFVITPARVQSIEVAAATDPEEHSLAVDDKGGCAIAQRRLFDQRKPFRPVTAVSREKPHSVIGPWTMIR